MKPLLPLGLCCLLGPAVFAGNGNGFGGFLGGGRGGVAAGGHPPAGTHAPGRIFSFGPGRGREFEFGRFGTGLAGFGGLYGGFFGDYEPFAGYGYAGYGYNEPANSGGPAVVVLPVVTPSARPVVTETAHPVMHDYTQPAEQASGGTEGVEHGNQPIVYLIAFHDGNIRAAMTYWVENGTLHYLDTAHKERQAAMASVDRDLSAQLNRERHVPFSVQ